MDENQEIKIFGEAEPVIKKYGKVKNLVVKLSGDYYFKHSDQVTQVTGADGKRRFYRKASPLIIESEDVKGTYLLKSMMYKTEDGVYLDPKSPKVVRIDDKYYRKEYTVVVNDKRYLKTDPLIASYGAMFFLKEDAVALAPTIYGVDRLYPQKDTILTHDGFVVIKADTMQIMDTESGELVHYHKLNLLFAKYERRNVLYDFQDKTNPQENRLVFKEAIITPAFKEHFVQVCLAPGFNADSYWLHKSRVDYIQLQVNDFIMPRKLKELEIIRQSLNRKYSDLDETENTAKIFKHIKEPYPGKQNIYTSSFFGKVTPSKRFLKTGGLKYSFGVEIETSDGEVPKPIIEKIGVSCVGDRSIGAGEYVTSPLHGDDGLQKLALISEVIKEHCLVDDRCSIHVHVGGIEGFDKPKFNRDFMINAIKLGCHIEEELYKTLPESRNPTLYHCHSIRRWKGTNKKNYNTHMGAYIFGEKEWWLAPQEVGQHHVEPFFDFSKYKLGMDYNKKTKIEQWQDGRYKWLNLIGCFSDHCKDTLEFRIFSGTLNFDKIWAYVMFSLAFTYVVDNHPGIIKKGITLKDIVDAAFAKYPDIAAKLNDFHEMRKAKFKRERIYPENHWPVPEKYKKALNFLN